MIRFLARLSCRRLRPTVVSGVSLDPCEACSPKAGAGVHKCRQTSTSFLGLGGVGGIFVENAASQGVLWTTNRSDGHLSTYTGLAKSVYTRLVQFSMRKLKLTSRAVLHGLMSARATETPRLPDRHSWNQSSNPSPAHHPQETLFSCCALPSVKQSRVRGLLTMPPAWHCSLHAHPAPSGQPTRASHHNSHAQITQ